VTPAPTDEGLNPKMKVKFATHIRHPHDLHVDITLAPKYGALNYGNNKFSKQI